jgi:hypothetical protein
MNHRTILLNKPSSKPTTPKQYKKSRQTVKRSKVLTSGRERTSFHNEVMVVPLLIRFKTSALTPNKEFESLTCLVGRIISQKPHTSQKGKPEQQDLLPFP